MDPPPPPIPLLLVCILGFILEFLLNFFPLVSTLVVSSLSAHRVGSIDDPNVLPCVGNDAYSAAPPVYESSFSGLSILQQRSPIVKDDIVFERQSNLFALAIANVVLINIILSLALCANSIESIELYSAEQYPKGLVGGCMLSSGSCNFQIW
ncbi:unnamed protein product [Cuscuta europaea]|uniref:Uncharacterized protein n=1 Tax=Cuscuta europaea TaxID=41803 RepID=A0A9P0YZ61_CUSEU|nr:unnamed protein product [Cuscuta europaea]